MQSMLHRRTAYDKSVRSRCPHSSHANLLESLRRRPNTKVIELRLFNLSIFTPVLVRFLDLDGINLILRIRRPLCRCHNEARSTEKGQNSLENSMDDSKWKMACRPFYIRAVVMHVLDIEEVLFVGRILTDNRASPHLNDCEHLLGSGRTGRDWRIERQRYVKGAEEKAMGMWGGRAKSGDSVRETGMAARVIIVVMTSIHPSKWNKRCGSVI